MPYRLTLLNLQTGATMVLPAPDVPNEFTKTLLLVLGFKIIEVSRV